MKCLLRIALFCLFTRASFAQTPAETAKLRTTIDSLMNHSSYGNNPKAGKFYDVRGFKMYCEIYGEGEPVLIIHGNGGSINNFFYQIPYFSKRYKVIIADSRAQGKSADLADSLSYEMMADDYAALLDALKIPSAKVIGWSDGGINALLLAIRHPEKVSMLAVTGANLRPDTSAVDPGIVNMLAPVVNQMKTSKDTSAAFRASRKLFRLLVEEPNIPLAFLHTIKVPSLVIAGDHDVLRVRHTVEIFENIPNSYLWILPNSGHSTPLVYADEFNQKIDAFFRAPYRRIEGESRFF